MTKKRAGSSMAEQGAFNPEDAGSSPVRPTSTKRSHRPSGTRVPRLYKPRCPMCVEESMMKKRRRKPRRRWTVEYRIKNAGRAWYEAVTLHTKRAAEYQVTIWESRPQFCREARVVEWVEVVR